MIGKRLRNASARLAFPGLGHRRSPRWRSFGAGEALAVPSAAIVVDAKTGKVLYSSNADTKRYPASLTKMMTLYLLFEAIERARRRLDTRITVSLAAAQPPSKLGLKPGQTITVKDAILALVTGRPTTWRLRIAEHLGGTESALRREDDGAGPRARHDARRPSGTPPACPNPAQVTTARDMALLGRALQDHFPDLFPLLHDPSFTYNGARSATTTASSAGSKASTASRPATPAPRASTSSPRSTATTARSSPSCSAASSGTSRDARMAEAGRGLHPEGVARPAHGRPDPAHRRERPARPPSEAIEAGPAARLRAPDAASPSPTRSSPLTRPMRPGRSTAAAAVTAVATGSPPDGDRDPRPRRIPRPGRHHRRSGCRRSERRHRRPHRSPRFPPMRQAPPTLPSDWPTCRRCGWKIQLAAAPTQTAAKAILDRARNAGAEDRSPRPRPIPSRSQGLRAPSTAPASPALPARTRPGRLRLSRQAEVRLPRHRATNPTTAMNCVGVRFCNAYRT